jgi:extracellular sulfatase Sulf
LYSNKLGHRSKYKWPDTFLIESSGRRETAESIAEAKTRESRKQAKMNVKNASTDDNNDTTSFEDLIPRKKIESGLGNFFDVDNLEDSAVDDLGKYLFL